MFRANKSVVGLDLGSSSIKAVELTKARDRLRLTGFGCMEIASDANRSEVVAELFRRSKFRTRFVVGSVSGKSVHFRYVDDLVKMSHDELRRALRFEAEKYFPSGMDTSEMELDCQILGDGPPSKEGGQPQLKALLVGVKRSLVEDQARILLDAGLHPMVIDVDAFAIANAFELAESLRPTLEPGKAVALLDLGAVKTSINILSEGTSRFAREVYIGGNDFTSAIARGLGLETLEAETLKCNPKDESDVERICKAVAPVLDELTNEVKLSFDYFEHQSDKAVDLVFLSGGGALAPYLEGAIERAVERKSCAWNPVDCLEVDPDRLDAEALKGWAPALAVAVGLASRLLDKEGRR